MIKRVRDDHSATPRKAHKLRQMLSRLYSWANEEGLVDGYNPAAKIKRLKVRQKAITPWSEDEIARFLAAAPLWLQTPVLLALCTGQRREDVVRMTWADYQGAFVRVRQSKTGEPLDIACHKVLRSHLSAFRTAFGGPIARNAKGKPFTANSLSQAIRRQVRRLTASRMIGASTGCATPLRRGWTRPDARSRRRLRFSATAPIRWLTATWLRDGLPRRNASSGAAGMNRERTKKLLKHTGLAVLKRPDGGVVTQRTANPLPRRGKPPQFAQFTVCSAHAFQGLMPVSANAALAKAHHPEEVLK
jgi:integrase